MKKLAKCKAVRVCREIRAMFVQMYRKLQEINGKTHESALKTHESVLYLINNARKVRYFCVKMTENNEKNEQNMCRMYMKYVESMCILYKKQCKRCSKKHAKREIMLHYCAK